MGDTKTWIRGLIPFNWFLPFPVKLLTKFRLRSETFWLTQFPLTHWKELDFVYFDAGWKPCKLEASNLLKTNSYSSLSTDITKILCFGIRMTNTFQCKGPNITKAVLDFLTAGNKSLLFHVCCTSNYNPLSCLLVLYISLTLLYFSRR